MKKLLVCVVFLFLFSTIPASAETSNAEYCFGAGPHYCQYLADDAFESSSSTAWTYSAGSGWSYESDPCAGAGSGDRYNGVARLEPGGSVWQYHATDADEFPHWDLELDLYKTSTAVGVYDRFAIFISGSGGMSENHVIYARSYSGLCASNILIPLSNDYSGQTVMVRVRRYAYSTVPMYIDNLQLWGSPF